MQRLEDPQPVLSTSTDLQRKHSQDVVHDVRELRSLPLSLLLTSLLLDFALFASLVPLYVHRTVPCAYSLRMLFTLSVNFRIQWRQGKKKERKRPSNLKIPAELRVGLGGDASTSQITTLGVLKHLATNGICLLTVIVSRWIG